MKTHKEVGLEQLIKVMLLLFIGGAFNQCRTPVNVSKAESDFYSFTPKELRYDTLKAVFYFENLVYSYIESDAIVKSRGFILKNTSSQENAYKRGYYIWSPEYLVQKSKEAMIHYDSSSLRNLGEELYMKPTREGTAYSETNINPFCGVYYKEYYMEMEVLYIDTIPQRMPLIMDCNEYDKYVKNNKGTNYRIEALPTYIITNVFLFTAL